MRHQLLLRVVANLLIPCIILFGLYVQLHGKYSPGGGFQAGVLVAVAYILYALLFGVKKLQAILSLRTLKCMAAGGVLIYALVGLLSLLLGKNYLDYAVLSLDGQFAQQLGIMLVELGVGLTVFAASILFFMLFTLRALLPHNNSEVPHE